MNKLLIVCAGFLLFIRGNITAQPPVQHFSNKGDSLYAEGNIPEAIAEYRKLLAYEPDNAGFSYNLACAYSIDNSIIRQFDSCFKYLNIAVTLDTSFNALTDPSLLSAREDQKWKVFEERLVSMLNVKFRNQIKDIEFAKALWRLSANDQAFFNEIMIAGRKLAMRSSVTSALWRAKLIVSEKNQQELAALLEARGWPRVGNVGREAAMAAYLVVQHSNGSMQKKYLPDVKKMCEEKELQWERYAMMYDRMCTNERIPQRYGTHTVYNEKTGKTELYPLEDPSKTDQWRKEAGLEPLADYLAKNGIVYAPVSR
ncbi:MAG: tetratricopeptide repeat protein [Chloroflexota bacterium]